LVLPLLPFYAEHFGASPFVVGCLSASFAVCQLVSGPILGRISDRVGRKPTLLVSQLGSLLAAVGNQQLAIKHLTTALKLKPSAPVHFLIGAVYYGVGQHKRAIQHLKKATKLDPQFGEAHYQLGLLCLEMNWLRKAQECFKTAQALNPKETRYRKRVRSFSEDATGPDQLNTLIREELLLLKCESSERRTK